MNEKTQKETVGGLGSIQRGSETQIQEQIKTLEAQEAQLYAARGYGGYIHTETLTGIRQALAAAQQRIHDIRSVSLTSANN